MGLPAAVMAMVAALSRAGESRAARVSSAPPTPVASLQSAILLQAQNVSIAFGGLRAVQDFSCSLPARALHGLIGPNGAGKTTVFNLLTGVYRPQSGSVYVAARRVDGFKPHQNAQAGGSRTFQNVRLFGGLSVIDNVGVGLQGKH